MFEKIFSKKENYRTLHKIYTIFGIKIKKRLKYWKRRGSLNKRLELLEKRVFDIELEKVYSSGLWNPQYYIKNNCPDLEKYNALLRYLALGKDNKENPSEVFNAEKYENLSEDSNAILDFMQRGRYKYAKLFPKNAYPCPQCLIDNYNKYKLTRESKKVIYTCITNNYDSLDELAGFYYTDFDWDYVCYTDNQDYINRKQIGIWEIRPLAYFDSDNTRNNRWHKMHPHILFSNYDESVYIDANINILTSYFFDMVNNTDKDIMLPYHALRVDIYKELEWANSMGFEGNGIELKMREMFKAEGFPENYGMFENNVIYRKHHSQDIIDMMNEWWEFVRDYCKRDQCSLAYLFWKHNRQIKDYAFENVRIDYKNFCIFEHKGVWERVKTV